MAAVVVVLVDGRAVVYDQLSWVASAAVEGSSEKEAASVPSGGCPLGAVDGDRIENDPIAE